MALFNHRTKALSDQNKINIHLTPFQLKYKGLQIPLMIASSNRKGVRIEDKKNKDTRCGLKQNK